MSRGHPSFPKTLPLERKVFLLETSKRCLFLPFSLFLCPSQTGFLGLYPGYLLLLCPRAFAPAAQSSIPASPRCVLNRHCYFLQASSVKHLFIKAILRRSSTVTFCIPLLFFYFTSRYYCRIVYIFYFCISSSLLLLITV